MMRAVIVILRAGDGGGPRTIPSLDLPADVGVSLIPRSPRADRVRVDLVQIGQGVEEGKSEGFAFVLWNQREGVLAVVQGFAL